MRNIVLLACFAASPLQAAHAQVLDPPNTAGQDQLETALVQSLEGKDLEKYRSLLADRLTVSQDGKVIAQDKTGWLRMFGEMLTAEGVQFKVIDRYSSSGRILFVQYFNSAASWGGTAPAECCWSYDAVAYDYKDAKITRISILRGGEKSARDAVTSQP